MLVKRKNHEEVEEDQTERSEMERDLDVPEKDGEDVRGGVSLNYTRVEHEYKSQ